MIICPGQRFVFVHVPKCAGTSIRDQIEACDPDRIVLGRVGLHPELGKIDYGHIPLDLLRQHFPDHYAWLIRPGIDSFAVLRDPLARAGSAVRQVIWRYEKRPMTLIPAAELREMTLRMLDEVAPQIDAPDHRFAFFLKQERFIFDQGRQVTQHLIPLDLVDPFIDYLSRRTGVPMTSGARANQNVDLRFKGVGQAALRLNAVFRRHLPRGLHARVKQVGLKVLATKKSAAETSGLLDIPELRAFVAEHYARDARLYAEVVARREAIAAALADGTLAEKEMAFTPPG